jgi:hypothetical protein
MMSRSSSGAMNFSGASKALRANNSSSNQRAFLNNGKTGGSGLGQKKNGAKPLVHVARSRSFKPLDAVEVFKQKNGTPSDGVNLSGSHGSPWKKTGVAHKFNGHLPSIAGLPAVGSKGLGQGGAIGSSAGKGIHGCLGGKWSPRCHGPWNFFFPCYAPYYWPTPGSYTCPTVIYHTCPQPVVVVAEAQPVSPATTVAPATSHVDLVLDSIELAQPATPTSGPVYRIRFHNQGTVDAGAFRVGLVMGFDDRPIEDSPRAVADVPGLAASQGAAVELRLPLGSTKLATASAANSSEFSFLAGAVDVDEAVSESNKTNNVASVSRGELQAARCTH